MTRKLSEWQIFLKLYKNKGLSITQISAEYRKTHNIQLVNKSKCKSLHLNECNTPCKWIIPKKITKKGLPYKQHCKLTHASNANYANYADEIPKIKIHNVKCRDYITKLGCLNTYDCSWINSEHKCKQ